MHLENVHWRKSTHSGENGGNCIELARLPSDTLWRKSTHTTSNGGNCVELARVAAVVAVRDSKDPDGPVLLLAPAALRNAVNSALTPH